MKKIGYSFRVPIKCLSKLSRNDQSVFWHIMITFTFCVYVKSHSSLAISENAEIMQELSNVNRFLQNMIDKKQEVTHAGSINILLLCPPSKHIIFLTSVT